MTRSLGVAVLLASVCLSLGPGSTAATASDHGPGPSEWLGALFTDLWATTSHDFHQDRVQPLVPSWLMTLNAFGTTWPARIEATTTHDPALLAAAPGAVPVTVDGVTTYTWSGGAPVFTKFIFSNVEVRRDLGFTARRELVGGRHVAVGNTQRELRITIRANVALPQTNVNIASFGSAPVTVTTASCPGSTPHPFPQFGGIAQWSLGPLGPGEERVLTCTLDLTNDATFKASFMPDVQISATRSIAMTGPVGSSEVAIASDTLQGAVTFSVEPGPDEIALAFAHAVDRRGLRMIGEDRVLAPGRE
jgi:hypothetical protein